MHREDPPVDRALRAIPPHRRFIVAYANPDRPQIVMTLHSKDDDTGDSYATRTLTLEDAGLVIFDSRNSFKDIVAPRDADGVSEQVRALVYAFADECGVGDEDLYFGGRRGGGNSRTERLELPPAWTDPGRVRRAQDAFRRTEKRTAT